MGNPAPGDLVISTIDDAVSYDPSLATDQLFIAGITARGPVTPKRTFSLASWEKLYGGNVELSILRACVEAVYKEGQYAIVTCRAVGPNAAYASRQAENAGEDAVIELAAAGYGVYGNTIATQFVAGADETVKLKVTLDGKTTESGDLASQAAIVSWANATGIITAKALAGEGLPVVDGVAVGLTGGDDDAAKVTDAIVGEAVAKFDSTYGPGQLWLPGRTTEAAQAILVKHHLERDRVGLVDTPDSAEPGTATGAVLTTEGLEGCDGLAAFVPWLTTPSGDEVPGAALVAAKIAVSDRATGNPNEPAAGDNGEAQWVTGLTQAFTEAQRVELDEGHVNAIIDVTGDGQIQVYGFDTLADPETDPLGTAFSNARLDMYIRWSARKVAAALKFREIDSKGLLASAYQAALTNMLSTLQGDGVIYGFTVDTAAVNNAQTAEERKLLARIGVERSKFAKVTYLEVVNYAIGGLQ